MLRRLPLVAACLLLTAPLLYADDPEDAAAKTVEKVGGSVTAERGRGELTRENWAAFLAETQEM
jgi:hypothetical protein